MWNLFVYKRNEGEEKGKDMTLWNLSYWRESDMMSEVYFFKFSKEEKKKKEKLFVVKLS